MVASTGWGAWARLLACTIGREASTATVTLVSGEKSQSGSRIADASVSVVACQIAAILPPLEHVCAVRCLAYIDERSGLIAPDGNDTYAFVHLTLQEHCAGRYIALQSENLIDLVMQHRADDRWREPIFLGMGVADPRDINEVLQTLIERDEPHNEPRASGLCW